MINQLLRLGFLIATGRFFKPRIKGLLWVTVVWVVLWYAHSEYVDYVELSGDTQYVLQATLLKSALYALSILVYVLLVERRLWPKSEKAPKPVARAEPNPPPKAVQVGASGDDGFDFLRKKKKLRNQAEDLLGKKS